jgi:Fe-S cluster assembly iron-binding protein IscA
MTKPSDPKPLDPWADRPKPPPLKRFANLEIDGLEPSPRAARSAREAGTSATTRATPSPARSVGNPQIARPTPAPSSLQAPVRPESPRPQRTQNIPYPQATPSPEDAQIEALTRLVEDLNDNVRSTRESLTPQARRTQRALELRRSRPPDPPPRSREPTPAELAARRDFQARRDVDRIRFDLRPTTADALELDLPDLRMAATPGVLTMEVDLRARRDPGRPSSSGPNRAGPRSAPAMVDAPRSSAPYPPRAPAPATRATPIELTPLAARQIQLMAWEAGVPGSALRILSSPANLYPGMTRPELDFAFDTPEPDDHVFDCLGVTVLIDPATFPHIAGRRISWLDVPGSEGFAVR